MLTYEQSVFLLYLDPVIIYRINVYKVDFHNVISRTIIVSREVRIHFPGNTTFSYNVQGSPDRQLGGLVTYLLIGCDLAGYVADRKLARVNWDGSS